MRGHPPETLRGGGGEQVRKRSPQKLSSFVKVVAKEINHSSLSK